jgi:hypothetical protein
MAERQSATPPSHRRHCSPAPSQRPRQSCRSRSPDLMAAFRHWLSQRSETERSFPQPSEKATSQHGSRRPHPPYLVTILLPPVSLRLPRSSCSCYYWITPDCPDPPLTSCRVQHIFIISQHDSHDKHTLAISDRFKSRDLGGITTDLNPAPDLEESVKPHPTRHARNHPPPSPYPSRTVTFEVHE